MPRPTRDALPDGPFHVMSRAIEGQRLFHCEADYRRYLGLLQLAVERHAWTLHTFALMPNHVHFLLAGKTTQLSDGFQRLHWQYAEHYKRTYRPRLGHIFGGRPKMKPIARDPYMLAVMRYIALNPVGVLVARPEDYRWSAHRVILGKSARPAMLNGNVLGWFDGSVDRYERFVLGGEPSEHIAIRRWARTEARPELESIVVDPTPEALLAAHDTWDYSVRAIARATGMNRSAVQLRIEKARNRPGGLAPWLTE